MCLPCDIYTEYFTKTIENSDIEEDSFYELEDIGKRVDIDILYTDKNVGRGMFPLDLIYYKNKIAIKCVNCTIVSTDVQIETDYIIKHVRHTLQFYKVKEEYEIKYTI